MNWHRVFCIILGHKLHQVEIYDPDRNKTRTVYECSRCHLRIRFKTLEDICIDHMTKMEVKGILHFDKNK